MSSGLKLGLIINTANQPDYLRRVLRAVSAQSFLPDEVLLADDGSGPDTAQSFAEWSSGERVRTEHAWQKNEGFRRARILNEAIGRSRSDYIVFLDGDTIPHPEFVADHRRLGRTGRFMQGHRALVGQKAANWFGLSTLSSDRRRAFWSGQIEGWKHAFRWPRPIIRERQDLKGIRGCNLAVWREDLVKVNGYNEAFVGWGREDSELAVRLMNLGVRRLDVRGWALCYHLWHRPANRSGLQANDEVLLNAQRAGSKRCENGLEQHLPAPPP